MVFFLFRNCIGQQLFQRPVPTDKVCHQASGFEKIGRHAIRRGGASRLGLDAIAGAHNNGHGADLLAQFDIAHLNTSFRLAEIGDSVSSIVRPIEYMSTNVIGTEWSPHL
jgi:hypothetical protein